MAGRYNDVWKCCNCSGLNLIANAPSKCPVCSHSRCGYCTDGGSAYYMSAPATRAHETRSRSQKDWTLDEFLSLLPRPVPAVNPSSSANNNIPIPSTNYQVMACKVHLTFNPEMFARPSMRGWWYCHASGNEHLNNPALSPDVCIECGHRRCPWCPVEQ